MPYGFLRCRHESSGGPLRGHSSRLASFFQNTGLDLLARAGAIDLRVAPAAEESPLQWVDYTPPGRAAPLHIAFDLSDHSDLWIKEGLEHCDLYFKRSYYRPHVDALSSPQRAKVISFGLNYSCATRSIKKTVGRVWMAETTRQLFRSPRRTFGRANRLAGFLRQFLVQPDYRLFEQSPETPVESLILFQTRVWEPEESSEDLEKVNEERAALVRALRKAFGARFRGGLVPTPFAQQRYPDVLLKEAFRRTEFIRMTKQNLIGVYTRGLHHSTGVQAAGIPGGLDVRRERPPSQRTASTVGRRRALPRIPRRGPMRRPMRTAAKQSRRGP